MDLSETCFVLFEESMLHCHIWIVYVCQHCRFISSRAINIIIVQAINIIIVQAKPSTSSLFKQSNQHHHFSSKAIKFQRDHFSSKAINIIFQASNQHHHCSSKAISIIIFQATSSLFFFVFFFVFFFFINIISIICWHFI